LKLKLLTKAKIWYIIVKEYRFFSSQVIHEKIDSDCFFVSNADKLLHAAKVYANESAL